MVGDASHEFDNWVPYFARGLNYTPANAELKAANDSVPVIPVNSSIVDPNGRPQQLTHSNFALPLSSWAQLAFQAFGFPDVNSFFEGTLLGSAYAALFLDVEQNHRQSSEADYLQTALRSTRSNIQVLTHSLVTKIIFDANLTPTNVSVRAGQLDFSLAAHQEIILSAGAFQSPQLLMVSDRPGVGQNMWDHIDIEVTVKTDLLGSNSLNDPVILQQQLDGYYMRPPVSIYGIYGVDYIGWEKLPNSTRQNLSSTAQAKMATFPADWPEVEYEVASVVESMIEGDTNGYGTFVVILVAPLSRGTVTIMSDSMLDQPVINPNWLTEPTDVEVAIQAVRRARAIAGSNAMAPILVNNEFSKELQTIYRMLIWRSTSETTSS